MTARRLFLVLAGLIFSLGATAPSRAQSTPSNLLATGDFDFYVFTLSWSPGFCDTGGANKSPDQCAVGSGQGFVVHGLWPDNVSRPYPQDCGSAGFVSGAALRQTHGVYPAEGLARYEYGKHGTCTGLSADNYFAAVKWVRDEIAIPPMLKAPHSGLNVSPYDIENAFVAANPNLTTANMAVTCARGELIDVRICIAKTLDGFADCPKISGHSCRSRTISVSPLR